MPYFVIPLLEPLCAVLPHLWAHDANHSLPTHLPKGTNLVPQGQLLGEPHEGTKSLHSPGHGFPTMEWTPACDP